MILQIQPYITDEDINTVVKYLKTTWVTEGPATKDFEEMFCSYTKSKYALAFCNGTMSIFAGLKALGIGVGDEVIVPSITFVATINAVILTGATPVVVDIDFDQMGLSVENIKQGISKKTKAILPVHLYGYCVDIESIVKYAKENNYYVVEDAAQGVGVKFKGKHVGTFGEYGSFSFYGNKTMTTGEGGMLVTQNEELRNKAYELKNHGRLKKGVFYHEKVGYNFSISDLQSALGVAQMNKLEFIIQDKKRIYDYYVKNLSDIKQIKFPKMLDNCSPVYWFTSIILENEEVLLKLSDFLKNKEIQTRRAFFPIHMQPCYIDNQQIRIASDCKIGKNLYERLLSLPSSVGISEEDLQTTIQAIKEFFI